MRIPDYCTTRNTNWYYAMLCNPSRLIQQIVHVLLLLFFCLFLGKN
ncbi:MAG: hypothetical protein AVDCRST_MAG93-3, partial [uncultured Chloroflexia bacterium]